MRNKSVIKNQIISNKELGEELHKPIIKKFNKRKVNSPFIDNIRGADLADMQLLSKSNKELSFLLCLMIPLANLHQVIPLKDKKQLQLLMLFKKS